MFALPSLDPSLSWIARLEPLSHLRLCFPWDGERTDGFFLTGIDAAQASLGFQGSSDLKSRNKTSVSNINKENCTTAVLTTWGEHFPLLLVDHHWMIVPYFVLRRSLILQMGERSLLQKLGLMGKMGHPRRRPRLKNRLQAMRRKW